MQSFVCFIAIAVLATVVSSAAVGSTQQAAPQNILEALTEESNLNAPSELARWKKSAYGGGSSSYQAPPCPKTYLFSCQPNVAPVPCAPAQSGYAGAYSVPVPTYTVPQAAYPGVPQELVRPIRSYNQNTL